MKLPPRVLPKKKLPVSITDTITVKKAVLDRNLIYPSSVQAWLECPYRYVYDRRGERVSSAAQERGTEIHAAIGRALNMPDGVCCPIEVDTSYVSPAREVLSSGMTKLHKATFFGTVEAQLTRDYNGIQVAGKIDLLVECVRHNETTAEVVDIKTMKQLRSDKIAAYLESIQFTWYAYVSKAWRVYCWPVLSTDEHARDGVKAVRSALAYVKEHPEQCIKTFANTDTAFLEQCATPLERYMEWLTSSKAPAKTANKWCKWCNAYTDNVCAGR